MVIDVDMDGSFYTGVVWGDGNGGADDLSGLTGLVFLWTVLGLR